MFIIILEKVILNTGVKINFFRSSKPFHYAAKYTKKAFKSFVLSSGFNIFFYEDRLSITQQSHNS